MDAARRAGGRRPLRRGPLVLRRRAVPHRRTRAALGAHRHRPVHRRGHSGARDAARHGGDRGRQRRSPYDYGPTVIAAPHHRRRHPVLGAVRPSVASDAHARAARPVGRGGRRGGLHRRPHRERRVGAARARADHDRPDGRPGHGLRRQLRGRRRTEPHGHLEIDGARRQPAASGSHRRRSPTTRPTSRICSSNAVHCRCRRRSAPATAGTCPSCAARAPGSSTTPGAATSTA